MSADLWQKLGVPLSTDKIMRIGCVNAQWMHTMGVIEGHLVQIGPIAVYLQIQVVEGAPYEVLLGRPFFDVLSCLDISLSGGDHMIQVVDPRTRETCVIPTLPCNQKTVMVAVNFRW